MTTRVARCLALLLIQCMYMSGSLSTIAAQTPPRGSANNVATTSFDTAGTSRPGSQQVTFSRRVPQVGDQVDQQLSVRIKLQNMVRQGTQIVGESKSTMTQAQRRVVTAALTRDQRIVAAQVRYLKSENQVQADGQPLKRSEDPVVGRTYRCARNGDRLLVYDDKGRTPSWAEYEIVARSMESIGRANPLAEFLAGRTIRMGETVSLPREQGEQLLGLEDTIDQIEQFDLTLTHVETIRELECGVFRAELEAAGHKSGQMRMQLAGPFAVELATCRVARIDLNGPIGLAESTAAPGTVYHMSGTGRLTVSIESSYDDVADVRR